MCSLNERIKQCSKCGLALPLKAFNKKKGKPRASCKECDYEALKQWRKNNREKDRAWSRQWSENNRERHRARTRRWEQDNPDKARAKNAKRRALKRQAVPPWASLPEIQKHYAHAQALNAMLPDCRFEVDHIFPLKSDFLCGLHTESNLMVLEASQNASKKNQWWPGQLPCQQGQGASHDWWLALKEKGMQ